ncbi:MAG: hypothetical protein WC934_02805 [Acidithiobacillus sp.]|jgi:hypothetical protein|uniref:hypothetical protein n=1 Tax=Acidithiobacillus sp. TaxID=1872118 RepID=UPI00355F3F71
MSKIEQEQKKMRQSKIRKQVKNSNKCFGLQEYGYLFFSLILFSTPFITVLLLRYNTSYNVITWNEYYVPSNQNYQYYIEGNYTDDAINASNCYEQRFELDNVYNEFLMPIGNGAYKNLEYGSYHYQFVINNSLQSDLVFCSQYQYDQKNIFNYFPFLYNLPIGITTFSPSVSGVIETQLNKYDFIIPSNWTQVWDNLEIYFYYINNINEGIAFSYGNNETVNNQYRNMELTTQFGDLQLKVFDLNVSGMLTYDEISSEPEIYYYEQMINENSFLHDYMSLIHLALGDAENSTNDFLGALPFDIGDLFKNMLRYNNTIVDVSQINGFPNNDFIPIVQGVKCGYYIKVDQDYNISYYYDNLIIQHELMEDETIGEYIVDNLGGSGKKLVNGISFFDGGLYIGKTVSMIEKLQQIFIYDLIIIFSSIGIMIILGMVFNYPKELYKYRDLRINECLIP